MEQLTFDQLPQAVTELQKTVNNIERLLVEKGRDPDPPPDEILMTVKETAAFLSLTVQSVYGLMHRKEINFQKKRKLVYFWKADLIRYLNEGRVKTASEIGTAAEQYLKNNRKKKLK